MTKNNDPYKFSITYEESVAAIFTQLSGYVEIKQYDENGKSKGYSNSIKIPGAEPLLTLEAAKRVREILISSMDKFNPLSNMRDEDCAHTAGTVSRSLSMTITLNADKYLIDYENDPSKLMVWTSYHSSLENSLYSFAALAKDGHFIKFAGQIMAAENPVNPAEVYEPKRRILDMFKSTQPKQIQGENQ